MRALKKDEIQKILLLRMNLKTVRDRINKELDALAAQIDAIIPEEYFKTRPHITDIKAEVRSWKRK